MNLTATRPYLFPYIFGILINLLVININCYAQTTYKEKYIPVGAFEFSVATGLGSISNPIKHAEDIPLYILPTFSYYGERFYMHNLDLGYNLFEGKDWYLDIASSADFYGLFHLNYDDAKLFGGMSSPMNRLPQQQVERPSIDRKLSYLAGIKTAYSINNYEVEFKALSDITSTHNGQLYALTLKRFVWSDFGNLSLAISAQYLTSDYSAYYFNTRETDFPVNMGPQDFVKEAALNYSGQIDYQYHLTQDLDLIAFIRTEFIDDAVTEEIQPVDNKIISYFLGVNWKIL